MLTRCSGNCVLGNPPAMPGAQESSGLPGNVHTACMVPEFCPVQGPSLTLCCLLDAGAVLSHSCCHCVHCTAASCIKGALSTISVAKGILIVPNKMNVHCRVGLRAPSCTPRSMLLLERLAVCCCCALRRCATRRGMANNRRFAVGLAAASLPLLVATLACLCSCIFRVHRVDAGHAQSYPGAKSEQLDVACP